SPPSRAESFLDWIAARRVIQAFKSAGIPVNVYEVPSESMAPSLLVHDIVVDDLRPPGIPSTRGEIMVVKMTGSGNLTIKRVIGLPGDEIQMKGGILVINGQAVLRQKVEDFVMPPGERLAQYIETLPGGFQHRIVERADDGPLDNTDVYIVPADQWFCLG